MTVKLQEEFHIPLISLANLISATELEETPLAEQICAYLAKGEKIPPSISAAILHDYLTQPDCRHGVILEENPFSIEEMQALKESLAGSFFLIPISIETSEEWLIQRFEHRWVCRNCGRVYDLSPPKKATACTICNGPLQRRLDDSPETIKSRHESYQTQATPVLDFLREQQLLAEIPGERNYDEIYKDVIKTIEGKLGHSLSDG